MMPSVRIVATTCPFCGVGCQLDLHVQGNQILKATSPYDSIVNHGNLCVKGRFGWDFIYSPRRVSTPLIKRSGKFELATWEEALDLTATRLVGVYTQHGSDALAAFLCAKAT